MDTQKMEKIRKIAVVILNWNGRKLLQKFLPKVVQFSSSESCQIIVADNSSDDDSVDYVKANFPSVRIILLEKNFGFAEGYNQGLKQIKAKYYVMLNSDVEVTQNWLDPILSVMENNQKIVAAQPKIKSYYKKTFFEYAGACGGFIDKLGYPFCRGRILLNVEEDKGQYDKMVDIFWASGTCLFIRSDTFHSLGGFDKVFHAHMEEIDLCWRINAAGYRVVCVPQSTIYHMGGATLAYDNPRKSFLNFRNSLFMLYKNLPSKDLWKVLCIRYTLDLLVAAVFLAKLDLASFLAVFKASISFPLHLKKLGRNRIKAQNLSKQQAEGKIFRKSILWQYFVKKNKKFSELSF